MPRSLDAGVSNLFCGPGIESKMYPAHTYTHTERERERERERRTHFPELRSRRNQSVLRGFGTEKKTKKRTKIPFFLYKNKDLHKTQKQDLHPRPSKSQSSGPPSVPEYRLFIFFIFFQRALPQIFSQSSDRRPSCAIIGWLLG